MKPADYIVSEEEEMAWYATFRPTSEEEAIEREAYARRMEFEAWADAEVDRLVAEMEAEEEGADAEEAPAGPSLPLVRASTEEDDLWAVAYAAIVRQEPVGFLSVAFEEERRRFWDGEMNRLHSGEAA